MYQKKELIFSETLGVCRVDDVTKLQQKNGTTHMYYSLRSMENKSKVAYIPVENHSVQLRSLITPEEARQKIKDEKEISKLEKYEIDFVIKMEDK